ncbi:hypothetical protein ASA1KI_11590 [Opitutales bacterium ASA1]|uniref:hypothetical protein n=1 Tax=Congregicoccus parvus TaxID=3081749 RepID=UPI002B281E7E|nr:hypothetical protein ASA1KI_11590 [Opitutales bacterium ASA1]
MFRITSLLVFFCSLDIATAVEPPVEANLGVEAGALQARGLFFSDSIELVAWVGRAISPRAGSPGAERGGGSRGEGGRRGGPPPDHSLGAKAVTLELCNRGSSEVHVEVVDFASKYGNFAVRPRVFVLAAGATMRAEPMLSRIEVVDTVSPLRVRLSCDGEFEEQTLVLRPEVASPSDEVMAWWDAIAQERGIPPIARTGSGFRVWRARGRGRARRR